MVEQLQKFKAPQSIIDAYLGDNTPREDDEPIELEVRCDCWNSVQVYRGIFEELAVGMGGIVWMGTRPTEILSQVLLLRIPRSEWPIVSVDVRYMAQVAAKIKNDQETEASKRRQPSPIQVPTASRPRPRK